MTEKGDGFLQKSFWTKSYMKGILTNFFIYMIAYQLMPWATIYSMKVFNSSVGEAGLASGIFIIGSLMSRLIVGHYIDIVGRKKIFFLGTVIYFIGMLLYFVVPNYLVFMFVRFFHGLGFGASSIGASTLVAVIVPKSKKGEGIGYFTLSMTIASAIGPFMALALLNTGNYFTCLYIDVAISVAIIVLTLFIKVPENHFSDDELTELHKVSFANFVSKQALPIAFIGFLAGVCFSTVLTYLATYADTIGLSTAAGVYFIIYGLASLISRPIIGKMLDRFGGNIVIYPALFFTALSMFLTGIAQNEFMLLIGAFLVGIGNAAITAGGHTLAIKGIPVGKIGSATATFYALLEMGYGLGPSLLGGLVPTYGFRSLYFAAVCIALSGVVFYYLLLGRTKTKKICLKI